MPALRSSGEQQAENLNVRDLGCRGVRKCPAKHLVMAERMGVAGEGSADLPAPEQSCQRMGHRAPLSCRAHQERGARLQPLPLGEL